MKRLEFEYEADKHLESRARCTANAMIALNFPLNNNQLGVSLAAAYRLEHRQHRQIYSVPAG